MTVDTKANLLARANQVRTETGGYANTASRLGGLFRDIIDSLFGSVGRYSVVAQGADPAGGNDPSAAFAAAAALAASTGGTVYVPKGTYGTGADWSFALPSGVTLEGDGDQSILRNCYVSAIGTAGSEIVFTAPAVKGATTISIPATGLTDAWLRLASCINMQSTDAGRDQLGHDAAAAGFFAEYVQVKTGNASTADLLGGTAWAYSNTPGGDSGSFTTSVARVMTFHEGGTIRKLKILGKNTGQNSSIFARFAKGLVVEDVSLDANDTTNQIVRFEYCLGCVVRGSRLVGKKNSVPAGSTANPIVFMSSQNCVASDCDIYNGGQGWDTDCVSNDATYRGGPSMYCGAINCRAIDNAADGFTSHWGCYGSFFEACSVKGSQRGIRIRDRGARVVNCRVRGPSGAGIGILIDEAAWWDAEVSENVVEGYLYNIQMTHSSTGYSTLQGLLGCGSTIIKGNTCRDAGDHGIYLNVAYTAATMCGPQVLHNEVHNPTTDGIRVSSYFNGTVLRGNRINGIASGNSALRYTANIKRLHIADLFAFNINAAGFALRGSSTSSFMTDAVTFPAGESEGQLYIGDVYTDAATPFQSIIRDTVSYLAPKRHGFGAFSTGMGNTGPTVERQTLGFYQRLGSSIGQTLLADTRDAANNFVTHQMVMRTSAADPNSVLTGSVGDIAVSTNTGAIWRKTSGTNTNTGWVTP